MMEYYTIFSLTNRKNYKRYFGICREDKYQNIVRRYRLLLDANLHPNKHLQRSWNHYWDDIFFYDKYGKYWLFVEAELVLNELIKKFNTTDGNYGYNHKGADLLNG